MKKYNSITNSMRHVCIINKDILSKTNSLSYLKVGLKNHAGRNNSGSITVRTKGTRHKRKYLIVDNRRTIYNIPSIIYSYEYDSNRSSFISLIVYKNNLCCYILSINNLFIGDIIYSYNNNNPKIYIKGDRNKLLYLTTGSIIHNVEYLPYCGGIYIRSAGTFGKLLKKYYSLNKALIELPSKKQFYTSLHSFATIGIVSNKDYYKIKLGKAGRKRWLGYKPSVRGVAMNPVDHPHGGGEGKKSNPAFKRSPWGKISKWHNNKKLFF